MGYLLLLLAASTLLVNGGAQAQSRSINLVECSVWPNERSHPGPALAIDGSTGTYTWSTQAYRVRRTRRKHFLSTNDMTIKPLAALGKR